VGSQERAHRVGVERSAAVALDVGGERHADACARATRISTCGPRRSTCCAEQEYFTDGMWPCLLESPAPEPQPAAFREMK